MRLNKIVATLWPVISNKGMLKQIDKFVDVYRINLSHANLAQTRNLIKDIRSINDKKVFMLDTKWPEIRTTNEEVIVSKWDIIKVYSTKKEWFISLEYEFFQNISENIEISFNDKAVVWNIISNNWDFLEVEIVQSWKVWYNKTVNFIWYEIELDFLTDRDKKDIEFWIDENIALLAVSFVKNAEDIVNLRKYLKETHANCDMKIISKIETASALEDIENIIKVSDGIMIARWDLWANVDIIRLPKIQKDIIKLCNFSWKPVILATQVMSSMVSKPIPTRAEIDEIAYNIQNGVDALMLSDESAIWEYPVETLSMLNDVIQNYQHDVSDIKIEWEDIAQYTNDENEITDYILYSAKKTAYKLWVKFIIAPTSTWYTPWKISSLKPEIPVIAVTSSDKVFKYCNLMFWVKAHKIWESQFNYNELKRIMWEMLQLEYKWQIKWEDRILIVHSSIANNTTNMINGMEVIKFKDFK